MKKGFTLIELLTVLVILSILSIISVTTIISIQKKSKEKLYSEQIERIEKSAALWAIENSGLLSNKITYKLTLEELIGNSFLESSDILDPRNNSKMNGCVNIVYDQKYSYTYDETCGNTIYTINYALNGGNVVANPITYTSKTETFTLNNPIKFGNTFNGWTGTGINAPSMEVTITKGSTGDRSYTANFTSNYHTITYNLDGGEFVTSYVDIYYEDGPNITIMPPVKRGYRFIGWTGPGIPIPTMRVIIPRGSKEDKEYTANWELVEYNITYQLGDGILEQSNPTSYNINTPSFTLNNPTKTGDLFLGWKENTQSDVSIDVTIEQGTIGNKEYTANWEHQVE